MGCEHDPRVRVRVSAYELGLRFDEPRVSAPRPDTHELGASKAPFANGGLRLQGCLPVDVDAERGERQHGDPFEPGALRRFERFLDARIPEAHSHEDGCLEALGEMGGLRLRDREKRRTGNRLITATKLGHESLGWRPSSTDPREKFPKIIEIFDRPVRNQQDSVAGAHEAWDFSPD
jgi:hypothetical protein